MNTESITQSRLAKLLTLARSPASHDAVKQHIEDGEIIALLEEVDRVRRATGIFQEGAAREVDVAVAWTGVDRDIPAWTAASDGQIRKFLELGDWHDLNRRADGTFIPVAPVGPPDELGWAVYCPISGKALQMLKRYMDRTYNLSLEEVRMMFGDPDFTFTAPAYTRSKPNQHKPAVSPTTQEFGGN